MRSLLLVSSVLAVSISVAAAEDKPVDPAKEANRERIIRLLEQGLPGAYPDEKGTKDGEILRVYVVGTSTISTALGAVEGLEIARERAEESAKAEFVKFLGSKVKIRKTVKNEILLTKEGAEGDGGEGFKEGAKMVERRTKEFEETPASLVRGLRAVGSDQVGKDKKVIVVYRWDAKSADAAARDGDKLAGKDGGSGAKGATTKPDKTIPDKRIIIDD